MSPVTQFADCGLIEVLAERLDLGRSGKACCESIGKTGDAGTVGGFGGQVGRRRSGQEVVGRSQCLIQDGQTGGGVGVAQVERRRDMNAVTRN